MSQSLSRRSFVCAASGLSLLGISSTPGFPHDGEASPAWWPMQDPALVKEMVTVAHFNPARVRELIEARPALVHATLDWGFGDWEDALGGASHVGNREIAEMLLASGARLSIFAATMLGQLDVVKAMVSARPGVQRALGPHGITLLQHAKAGGAPAAEVAAYLTAVGDADRQPPSVALDAADRDLIVGRYRFGAGPRDYFDVDVERDRLGIGRPEMSRRSLFHTGSLVFFPAGVPSVHIAFARVDGKVTQLTVADPEVFITAQRF